MAVLLASAAAGCTGAGSDKTPLFEQAAAREIAAHPRWYTFGASRSVLIARDGVPRGLIWGTMHVDYGEDTLLPRPIRDRFAEAASLSVEVDSGRMSPDDLRRHRQRSLDTHAALTRPDPAALARLDPRTRAALDAAGLPPDSTSRHSLLGLTLLLPDRASRDPTRRGTWPNVDGLLVRFARGRGIPVRGLEDAIGRGHPFDLLYDGDPNGPDAARTLRVVLRCGADLEDLSRWRKTAYARGRIAEANASQAFCTEPTDEPALAALRVRLLTRRNVVMADGIEAALAEPGFHFVAIGAAHLLGEDGVPALLQARGWTVTPCPGDRC